MRFDRKSLVHAIGRPIRWCDRRLPIGARTAIGIPVTLCGFLGFLPILGFWMVPLGLALIALDIPPFRRRVIDWLDRHDGEKAADAMNSSLPRSGSS